MSKWTDEEIEIIKRMYLDENKTYKEIGEVLGRKWTSVRTKVTNLGIQKKKNYITEHKCAVCGDTESNVYYNWIHDGELKGKVLCGKHYNQMCNKGKIIDPTPSEHLDRNFWTDEEKQKLEELYKEGKSLEDIAKQLTNHSCGSISCMASRMSLGDKYMRNNNPKFKAIYQDYDWMYERYINRGMSTQEIANECGASRRVIEKWCSEKFGLTKFNFKHLKKLTDKQKQVCMFGCLGDGHIATYDTEDGISAVYIESHADNQKDYVFWKYECLKDFCINPPQYYEPTIKYFGDKGYNCQASWRLSTREVDDLLEIKNMSKEDICKQMNEFGISLYLLDDGTRNKFSWDLSVAALSNEAIQILLDYFHNKLGVNGKVSYAHNGMHPYIRFNSNDSKKFDKIILNNIPNNLDVIKYKILDKRVA